MPIDTEIIRREAARAGNLLDGTMGRALRRAAWRALPQSSELQQDDLPSILALWAAELPGDQLTLAEIDRHEEPLEIISRVVRVAGLGDPLGDALEAARSHEHDLAIWVEDQKTAFRNGELADHQIRKLERLPGWTWD